MNQQDLEKEINLYTQQIALLQREISRIEGVVLYLQSKLKNIQEESKTDLTGV